MYFGYESLNARPNSILTYMPYSQYSKIATAIIAKAEKYLIEHFNSNGYFETGTTLGILNKTLRLLSGIEDFFVYMNKINKLLKVSEIKLEDDYIVFTLIYYTVESTTIRISFNVALPDLSFIQGIRLIRIYGGGDSTKTQAKIAKYNIILSKAIGEQKPFDFNNFIQICSTFYNASTS